MSRVLFNTILLILVISCKGQRDDYPAEVKAKGIENLYDKTKWFLYCENSYRKLDFKKGVGDYVTYGMLPLRFEDLQIRGDSCEIYFRFQYQGKIVDAALVRNTPSIGCVYAKKSDTIALVVGSGDTRYWGYECLDPKKCQTFEDDITKPQIISYIKQNKNKLDPWFRKEAIKRGVISE